MLLLTIWQPSVAAVTVWECERHLAPVWAGLSWTRRQSCQWLRVKQPFSTRPTPSQRLHAEGNPPANELYSNVVSGPSGAVRRAALKTGRCCVLWPRLGKTALPWSIIRKESCVGEITEEGWRKNQKARGKRESKNTDEGSNREGVEAGCRLWWMRYNNKM